MKYTAWQRIQLRDSTKNSSESKQGEIFSWVLAILLSIFAVYPALIHPVEEHAYDAAVFHVYRGAVFSAAQADGAIYPRWVQPINNGLGGPLFTFYSPMPYFLMGALNDLNIPHPLAWRFLTAAALLVASAGMFGLGFALFRRADIALLCATVFTYTSYLLRDLFERGSPQGWAVALFPWALWLLLRLSTSPSGLRFASASLCWASVILLHNTTALLLLPIVGIFLGFVIYRDGIRCALPFLAALVAGILLAAFYIIPFVAESGYVQLENLYQSDYALPAANSLQWQDLLSLPRVFDIGLDNNAIAESGGLAYAIVLLIGLVFVLWLAPRKQHANLFLLGSLVGWAILTFAMQVDAATPVWAALPGLRIFQFRWKLLSAVGLVSAVTLGYLMQWTNRFRGILITLLIAIFIGMHLPSLYPQLLYRYTIFAQPPATSDTLIAQADMLGLTSYNELLPRWRTAPFTKGEAQAAASTPIANLPPGGSVAGVERRTGKLVFRIETPVAFRASVYTLFFPGWVGYVDEKSQDLFVAEDGSGYILIDVPAGAHMVELRYEGTLAQNLGNLASGATAILLLLLAIVWRNGNKESEMSNRIYLQPRWWIPAAILLVAGIKAFWIDPSTSWLRWSSTCQTIQGATAQTDIWFGKEIRLCGYAISDTTIHPNDLFRITLYWQVNRPIEEPAWSFVHLMGQAFNPKTNNPLWGQQDKQTPGEHLIARWTPGKLYRDQYEFRIPPDTPPGDYQIEIGWWNPATGSRLVPNIGNYAGTLSVSHLDSLLISGVIVR